MPDEPFRFGRSITESCDSVLGEFTASIPLPNGASGVGVPQPDFRELYQSLLEDESDSAFATVLSPWLARNAFAREWVQSLAAHDGIPALDMEVNWELYALSRVNQALLLRFQHGRADGTDWAGPQITLDEYVRFAHSLGLTVMEPQPFSPFFHEIVSVEQAATDDQPIQLVATAWPCLMLGNMLFSRAGVRVSGGTNWIRKGVAETSTMYWAHRRKNRPYQDQSHGWGSNSQWRTRFRPDYVVGRELHFNVDGSVDLNSPDVPPEVDDDLSVEERIELVTNRCFITTEKPHSDLYPYCDRFRLVM